MYDTQVLNYVGIYTGIHTHIYHFHNFFHLASGDQRIEGEVNSYIV